MKNNIYFKYISLHNKLLNSLRNEVKLRRKIENELIIRLEKLSKENNNQKNILLRNFLKWELHNIKYTIKRNISDIKFIKEMVRYYPLG